MSDVLEIPKTVIMRDSNDKDSPFTAPISLLGQSDLINLRRGEEIFERIFCHCVCQVLHKQCLVISWKIRLSKQVKRGFVKFPNTLYIAKFMQWLNNDLTAD